MINGRIRENELLKGRKFETKTKDSTTIPRQFNKMLHWRNLRRRQNIQEKNRLDRDIIKEVLYYLPTTSSDL